MARRTEFMPYRPRTILNKYMRPYRWFWTRYTAYPYKGCQHHRSLYPEGSYGPARSNWKQIALRLKELCEQYGLSDRMPRPIIPADKRTLNKRIVEALANQLYYMELNGDPCRRVWAIEDTEQDLGLIYRQIGRKGLVSIQNVGPKLAQVVEALIQQWA